VPERRIPAPDDAPQGAAWTGGRAGPARAARLPGIIALALLALAPAAGSAEPRADARLSALEARVAELEARIAALEQRDQARDSGEADPDTGLVWTLADDPALGAFRISYKQLDAGTGRVELLLEITAPLEDPARWAGPGVAPGTPVPLQVRLRSPDGRETIAPLTLIRGTSADPGARLHLGASVDPAPAAAARQLIIEPAAD